MGRQKGGDAARSKSRPASSSLAASLLATGAAGATGGAGSAPRMVGFGGYVGSARVQTAATGGAVGEREGAEGGESRVREGQGGAAEAAASSGPKELAIGADVDGEAAAHLRRLAKKDATTKLKALEALQGVLGSSSAAQMQAMLPAWAFEYRRLVVDGSRAVCLATHATMALLVKGVGKGLAPHLRQLMGPWWVAQFDSTRDVAAAATLSFQAAFPTPSRRMEALAFAWEAVLAALAELLGATPQSLAAADRSLSVEEAKHRLDEVRGAPVRGAAGAEGVSSDHAAAAATRRVCCRQRGSRGDSSSSPSEPAPLCAGSPAAHCHRSPLVPARPLLPPRPRQTPLPTGAHRRLPRAASCPPLIGPPGIRIWLAGAAGRERKQ
ncbi:hypothetical protein CLOM_g10233 [Closterium sp. NIES-68]|nr:hypothetical protein CLOM_g10233 [Closterium sp. NIES-68]